MSVRNTLLVTKFGLALSIVAGASAPAIAEPTMPEIVATLVRQAGDAQPAEHLNPHSPGVSVTDFLTRVIYELGVNSRNSEDVMRLDSACEQVREDSPWACRLTLSIQWGDAESAYSAVFELEPAETSCGAGYVHSVGEYELCRWQLVNDRVDILLAG